MKRLLLICWLLLWSMSAFAAGGTCPSTANMDGGLYAAPTSCYYFDFASGSDSNDGLSEASGHPLKHAPGMNGCTSTCSGITPAAGLGFIFKGGVTWDYTVLPWAPGGSGSSSGNDVYGGCTGANCIYYGVDKSWFSGGSWTRPILSGGDWNSVGSTCFFDVDASGGANLKLLKLDSKHDIIIDNFEFVGACGQTANAPPGGNNPTYIGQGAGNHNTIENNYFHRFAYNVGASTNGAAAFDAIGAGTTTYHATYNVADFGDSGNNTSAGSTITTLDGNACCAGINGSQVYEDHNVFANMGACEDEIGVISRHDNLFLNCYAVVYGTGFHEHISNDGACTASQTITTYNNLSLQNRTVSAAQAYGFTDNAACIFYWFNDVLTGITPPYAAYMSGANGNTFHAFNDTIEAQDSSNGGPGGQIVMRSGGAGGTDYVYNLHVITSAGCGIFNVGTGSGGFAPLGTWITSHGTSTSQNFTSYPGCPVADLVVQTQATANGQGYTIGQTYPFSPTSAGNATVGEGVNRTADCTSLGSSNAATASLDSAACQLDFSGAVTYNTTSHTAVNAGRAQNTRPSSGVWDAGAYQFSSNAQAGSPSLFAEILEMCFPWCD